MVTLHILMASGRLAQFADIIATAESKGTKLVQRVLPLPDIDIVVSDDPNATIPEIGVGGYAPNAHRLDIYLNPEFPNLKMDLESKLLRTLAHELHHCARWNSCGYGKTLFEAVISEGLADHFDQEINDVNTLPWSTALSDDQIDVMSSKLIEVGWDNNYDHSAWFFGTQPTLIPRWTGYSLGYDIAKRYMEITGRKASALVSEPAESFFAQFKESIMTP